MDEIKQYAITVTYDGADFSGSQLQKGRRTVQGELEKALKSLTNEDTRVIGAGRTDSQVSAQKQVFTFRSGKELPTTKIIGGLNFYLPPDMAVRGAKEVDLAFSARRDALSRTYIYSIVRSPWPPVLERKKALWVRQDLDVSLMKRAAALLLGERDFAAFYSGKRKIDKNTVRLMYRAEVWEEAERICLLFEANSFLTHQVRNMAGAIVSIGLGDITLEQMRQKMETKHPGSFNCLPAHGLLLVSTNYHERYGL